MSTGQSFGSQSTNGKLRLHKSGDVARCFVALFPDPVAREGLDALAQKVQKDHAGSRRMQRGQLHLTLAFIGPLAEQRGNQVAQILDAVPIEPFVWTLDRIGGFARAHVLWVGGNQEPRLTALAQIVRESLDDTMVSYDRKAFSAHVTLLRNITNVPSFSLDTPILWHVTRPYLVVSDRDSNGDIQYRCWGDQPCANASRT